MMTATPSLQHQRLFYIPPHPGMGMFWPPRPPPPCLPREGWWWSALPDLTISKWACNPKECQAAMHTWASKFSANSMHRAHAPAPFLWYHAQKEADACKYKISVWEQNRYSMFNMSYHVNISRRSAPAHARHNHQVALRPRQIHKASIVCKADPQPPGSIVSKADPLRKHVQVALCMCR